MEEAMKRRVLEAAEAKYPARDRVKPRFVRIVPIGPDDTKSSTVGRIGIYTSDVDVPLKAENWSSNISITPWKFG
ncbi:hypothetical protein RvY_02664 [Ramazzottius varieornatus]|uniref:Uncharacterized protein n=1 Tax=Ramazzottius varieornatus TaxID=947166 RepID=A0A1D1UKJ3_RAMVA|nr:hypothetical protein RvY_02664 [Ramazzottius varieornatus]